MTNLSTVYGWGRSPIGVRRTVLPVIVPSTVPAIYTTTSPMISFARQEIPEETRRQLLLFIDNENHRPAREAYKNAALLFGLSKWLVRKLWIKEVLSRIENQRH